MLNQDKEVEDRTWSRSRRVFVGLCLIGLAGGVALLRGPARGEGVEPPTAAVPAARTAEPGRNEAIELVYIPDNAVGVIAFRPAATFQRPGMEKLAELVDAAIVRDFEAELVRERWIDPIKPGFPRLRATDIEWVACSVSFHRNGKESAQLHQLMTSGFSIRTTHPFDWLQMLHAWGIKTTEVREGAVVYHTLAMPPIGPDCGAYFPDDRTLVVDRAGHIRSLAHRGGRSVPAFAQNAAWQRASRGLLAVALNNQNAAFAKDYDLGRPDDAVVLSLVKGVNQWVLGVTGDDAVVLRAAAACQSPEASESLLRTIESLRALGQRTLEQLAHEPRVGKSVDPLVMAKALLANLRVDRADSSVNVRAEGIGTLSDFAASVEADFGAAVTNGEDEDESEDSEDSKP